MSSFELNKVVGAILLAAIVTFAVGKIGDNLVTIGGGHGGEHGAAVAEGTVAATAPAPPKKEPVKPILALLAKANPADGAKVFHKCQACHTAQKGGPNKIGPDLWNVIGRVPGTHGGFGYSDAMKEYGQKAGKWTYEHLNHFLHKPRDFVKGTKMTFAGLKRPADRADVLAYLRTMNDNPPPLPTQAEIDAEQKAYEAEKAKAEAPPPAPAKSAAAPSKPIKELVAEADPKKGEKVFHKCQTCHTGQKGGPNKIGPDLWNIVGRHPGTHEGYSYSSAMLARKDEPWTLERLNHFLTNPRGYVKGTKMPFAGIKKQSERADLLAYLRTLSDSPVPLK